MSASRILYVDDNRDAYELAAAIFKYCGVNCNVISAESAREALALIEEESFDIYIFDYSMPEMSGIELCRYIRQFDADTPIVFFSGMARPSDRTAALAAGANDYLIKPNDLERLPETIKRFLADARQLPPGAAGLPLLH